MKCSIAMRSLSVFGCIVMLVISIAGGAPISSAAGEVALKW